ncbi:hypothetical protein [Paenirhodobacter sp.]|uniref:hypothetical protein n=1 Tax=Paenirhodobacter sp. TaxID=1965326 RepID=UPI003B3C42D7
MEFATGLRSGTTVTFGGGSLSEEAEPLFAARADDGWIVVTDRTPFHPLSLSWPDQPGDRGVLVRADGTRVAVLDCRTGLLNAATGALLTGAEAAALPRGTPDTHAVVLHVVADPVQVGHRVRLEVDRAYRDALSLQHTGVHLAALALNQCAAPFWTRDYPDRDALGAPNLDKAAVAGSEITEDRSTDLFRLGKSLRKKGFDRDGFLADLPERAREINACLARMLEAPAPVTVSPGEGPLDGRRIWSTHLLGAEVAIPCGGTHIAGLDRIARIEVELAPRDEGFAMVTRSR